MRRHLALVALAVRPAGRRARRRRWESEEQKDKDVHVQLLAINDFHGNLEPPTGSSGGHRRARRHDRRRRRRRVPRAPASSSSQAENPNSMHRSAPATSSAPARWSAAAFHDEPTIEAMNALGLDVTSVGNHEFDEGVDRAAAHAERRLPPGRRLPGRRRLRRRATSSSSRPTSSTTSTQQDRSSRRTRSRRSAASRSASSA